MDNKERANLREKILSDMASLKKDVASLTETSRPVAPDDSIGRLTRMEAINSKNINEANLTAAKSRLSRLELALKRIDDKPDEYGICSECEEEIAPGRLMLMPESTRCINCAS